MTMTLNFRWIIYELPVTKIFSIYYFIRALLFTKPRSTGPVLIVKEDPDIISHGLGKLFFNNKWPMSWKYRGEDINLRREYYDDSYDWPWRQLHPRGFINEDGLLELQPHEEVSPTGENDDTDEDMGHEMAHLKGKEFSVDRGMEMTRECLDQLGIEYVEGYYDGE